MRQRTTFFQEPKDSIDPKQLIVSADSISTKALTAAREERLTIGLTQGLPRELYEVFQHSHELHIRWVTEEDFVAFSPLLARLSPGLHVFYTPEAGTSAKDDSVEGPENGVSLCRLLQKAFGEMECSSSLQTFTTLPTERFSHSTTHQYYTRLPSLDHLSNYIYDKICAALPPTLSTPCLHRLSSLADAATFELSYTSIAHALTLSAYFPPTTQSIHITHTSSSSRLEVGVLSVEQATEPTELSLGGFLTVIGEDDHPRATLFSFPSRHHAVQSTFSSAFLSPTGLHPTLELRIEDATPPYQDQGCKLHAHLTLPKTLFLDRYQFTDPLFLQSKNLAALRYYTTPVDLEAPAYTETLWGSTALLELSPPPNHSSTTNTTTFTASIPTHLRYLAPTHNTSGLTPLLLPYPTVFWACTAEAGSKFTVNPFDRTHLGYDGLFGPRTVFYHLAPRKWDEHPSVDAEDGFVMRLSAPVLDLDRAAWVEMVTAGVVLAGFAWVCWALWGVWVGSGYGALNDETQKEEVKAAREKKVK